MVPTYPNADRGKQNLWATCKNEETEWMIVKCRIKNTA